MKTHSLGEMPLRGGICSRCQGWLIQDQVVRLDPRVRIELWRCVNCGDLVDRTVLQNRFEPAKLEKHYPHRRALVSQPQFIRGRRDGELAGAG